jgi:GT2 family glycosyltransferase
MKAVEKLSISIVTMNSKQLTRNCLKSILEHTSGISFKIFLLDNVSDDGTQAMVREEFPEVEFIESDRCRGFTANQNIISRRVRSEYVLVLNNDTVFSDNSLKVMVEFLDANPQAGAVVCKILNVDGSFQTTCIRCDLDLLSMFSIKTGLEKLFPKSKVWGRPHMGYADRNVIQEVSVYSGACVMIRKKVLDEVGLLDENITFGPDDYDLSYRMRKKGWKIYYLPTAKVIHLFGQTRKINEETYLEEVRGIFYLYLKHYGQFQTFLLKLMMLYGGFLKPLFWFYLYIGKRITWSELKDNLRIHGKFMKAVIFYPIKEVYPVQV